MDDGSGTAEPWHDALNADERAALAAWAEHEASEHFADAVLAAWAAESSTETTQTEPEAGPGRRRSGRVSRLRGVIGLGTAVAAAAAVMLMVRVIPRDDGNVAAARCDHAGPPLALDPAIASPASDEPIGESEAEPSDARSVLGAEAMAVLVHHCMPCHDSTDPGAKAEALRVFDLHQPRWWSSMSDDQLREARLRVQELGEATDDERRTLGAFVDAELAGRDHAG